MFATIDGIFGICLRTKQMKWKMSKKPRLINHQTRLLCPFKAHWNLIDWVAIASGNKTIKSNKKTTKAQMEKKTKVRIWLTSSLLWKSLHIFLIVVIYIILDLVRMLILILIDFWIIIVRGHIW